MSDDPNAASQDDAGTQQDPNASVVDDTQTDQAEQPAEPVADPPIDVRAAIMAQLGGVRDKAAAAKKRNQLGDLCDAVVELVELMMEAR